MSKNCIVLINAYPKFIKNEESTDSIRAAAKRWGADFIEVNRLEEVGSSKDFDMSFFSKRLFFTRYKGLLKLSHIYDGILMIDSDAVINSNSPNMFDELEGYDAACSLDVNPSRFSEYTFNWIRYNQLKIIVDLFDYDCLDGFLEFDYDKHFENYFNEGVIIYKGPRIREKLANFLEGVENNPRILKALEVDFSCQNLANVFLTHVLGNVKILDGRWNWIMPDMAGKNGQYHDQFNPETGELVRWWEYSEYPPDWTDNIHRGKMHPYIYHFCGTPMSKEIGRNYKRWEN